MEGGRSGVGFREDGAAARIEMVGDMEQCTGRNKFNIRERQRLASKKNSGRL